MTKFNSIQKYYNMLKKYDKEYDWTYNLSKKDLLNYCKNLYNHNNYLANKCTENKIKYYDTANNREKVFETILIDIKNDLKD